MIVPIYVSLQGTSISYYLYIRWKFTNHDNYITISLIFQNNTEDLKVNALYIQHAAR